jgi:hypothetical protein
MPPITTATAMLCQDALINNQITCISAPPKIL